MDEKQIGIVGIIVEDRKASPELHPVMHKHADVIVGRQGIPVREGGGESGRFGNTEKFEGQILIGSLFEFHISSPSAGVRVQDWGASRPIAMTIADPRYFIKIKGRT